jgi:hypothetical protein
MEEFKEFSDNPEDYYRVLQALEAGNNDFVK